MDAVTHIATGLALGATVTFFDGKERPPRLQREWPTYLCGILASVAPDIDQWLPDPFEGQAEGLTYALYHRGHTHTVVLCVAFALLIAGALSLVPRYKRRSFPALLGLAMIGSLLHVGMDATNDYGVHPFWLLSNRWFYGDFIFLIEPLIFGALMPLALHPFLQDSGSSRVNMVGLTCVLLAIAGSIVFLWIRVGQGLWMTSFAAALATIWIFAHWTARCRWRTPYLPWASVLLVWLVFAWCSHSVDSEARRILHRRAPSEHVVQLVTTPAPANPFCWRVVAASQSGTGDIIVRMGAASLLPSWSPAGTCLTPSLITPGNVELAEETAQPGTDEPGTDEWKWIGRFDGKKVEFDEFARASGRVQAMKHFLRIPFWSKSRRNDGTVVIGDLRLDYEPDLEHYSKYLYTIGTIEQAPALVPPWDPPFFRDQVVRTDPAPSLVAQ